MLHSHSFHKASTVSKPVGTCQDRFMWIGRSTRGFDLLIARDPAPNDPDVHPIREPEPEPDTPEPEPGDEPERIDPIHTGIRAN